MSTPAPPRVANAISALVDQTVAASKLAQAQPKSGAIPMTSAVPPRLWRACGYAASGMGVFNGVSQWIAEIAAPLHLDGEDAGVLGALMLAGGLVGALVLAPISDRVGRRVPFIAACLGGAALCVLALGFAPSAAWAYPACGGLGLYLVPMMPIGMQYATELTPHTHEGASNGMAQLVGQASVVFVALMWVLRTSDGRFLWSLVAAAVMLAATAFVFARLREAREIPS